MSSLSADQVKDLTQRINERFAEFDVEGSRVFEWVTPGVVRLVFDVVEEWQGEDEDCTEDAQVANVTAIHDKAFTEGWKAGRISMRAELGLLEKAGGWVEPQDQGQRLVPSPSIIINQGQLRADIRDHTAYPRLDDHPNGADVFAGVHPVTGGPDQSLSVVAVADDPLRYVGSNGHHADELELSTATVVTLGAAHTGGNGIRHHAEPSPAAVATLGPEHTVVTPIVPRRPRTLAEVDGIEDDETDSRPTRAKLPVVTREQLIAELKRQAMAGAMPTRPAFDLAKPAVWPMSQMLLKRLDTTWANLADEAGLRLVRS